MTQIIGQIVFYLYQRYTFIIIEEWSEITKKNPQLPIIRC